MGRTPYQTGSKGKEHWYHTSGMMINWYSSGRTFGGYSDLFYGEPIDLQTGELFFLVKNYAENTRRDDISSWRC